MEGTKLSKVTTVLGSTETPLTMSSVEIHKLTGKQHAHVMRDIVKMLDELGEGDGSSFGGIYLDAYKRQKPCFNLPRREVDILLTGYSVPLRAKVIDRWRVLEAEVIKPQALALPDFTNPALAARAWASEFEGRVVALETVKVLDQKIAEDAPKLKVFNKLIDSKDLLTFQQFCTNNNLHQRKVKDWLREIGWVRESESDRNPLPTAKAVDAGYCDTKKFVTSTGRLKQQILFTGKAEAYAVLKAPDSIRKPVRKSKAKKAA